MRSLSRETRYPWSDDEARAYLHMMWPERNPPLTDSLAADILAAWRASDGIARCHCKTQTGERCRNPVYGKGGRSWWLPLEWFNEEKRGESLCALHAKEAA
ncbi:hypothetical protein [Burkholderia sp. SRS-W-2-2016]|uniref:hypothetical protein n=1 Tax=Burkholderia sp. SRS-W-2-2016 TaxID=1926878 RepID=UPI000A3FE4B7|nr:hypothetical protein [Burkholderia sp. SRS-W-2-2016]